MSEARRQGRKGRERGNGEKRREGRREGGEGVLVTAVHATGTLCRLNNPQPKPISLLDFHTILIFVFEDFFLLSSFL